MSASTVFSESCPTMGQLFFIVRRNGQVIEEFSERNMIMTGGRIAIAKLFSGQVGLAGTHVGVGTDGSEPNAEQTGLAGGVLVPAKSVSFARAEVDGDSVRWVATEEPTPNVRFDFLFGTDDANGMSIREFGLFCGDGTMFSRRIRESGKSIEKDSDIEIEGYWIIRF